MSHFDLVHYNLKPYDSIFFTPLKINNLKTLPLIIPNPSFNLTLSHIPYFKFIININKNPIYFKHYYNYIKSPSPNNIKPQSQTFTYNLFTSQPLIYLNKKSLKIPTKSSQKNTTISKF